MTEVPVEMVAAVVVSVSLSVVLVEDRPVVVLGVVDGTELGWSGVVSIDVHIGVPVPPSDFWRSVTI